MVYYVSALALYDHNPNNYPLMEHTRSHMPHHYTTQSPTSSHSSPQALPKVVSLNTSIWSDGSSPNPNGLRSTDTSEEGASKFFSSRTSSIGSSHSAESTSPLVGPLGANSRWPNHSLFFTDRIILLLSSMIHLTKAWMDAPYVFQLAHTQGWDILDVHMQPSGAVLVFATAAGARVHSLRSMAHWAGAVGRANEEEAQSYITKPGGGPTPGVSGNNANKQLEFSIFVGDLARKLPTPTLLPPFTSCRSAKIMVSPETGISKGYGFVRFTDEADQQRALIEMQGLYCLSRPMRLSHATAKSKPNTGGSGAGYNAIEDLDSYVISRAGAHILSTVPDTYGQFSRHSISVPDSYAPRMDMAPPRSRSVNAEELLGGLGVDGSRLLGVEGGRVLGMEGSRALLNSEIASRGGGLSEGHASKVLAHCSVRIERLIAEETLRGFFAPFGEIHYVSKDSSWKGCGFVQFVRKADAERAIERMQGYPIGGGKIRLSWGRSQSDKAAQAAAQAAQLGLKLGVPGNAKPNIGGGLQQGGNNFQGQPGTNTTRHISSQGGGHGGQQGGFHLPQQPFSHPQPPFVADGTTSPSGSMSPQQGSFAKSQQGSFGQSAQQLGSMPPQSLYEPSSAGLSRAYTTIGSSFQPFSSEPTSFGRPASGSVPMGHSASATAHLTAHSYPTRQSLAFEPDSFGLTGRERQLTAPAHSGSAGLSHNLKNLNLGLAGMNLSQRREFGLDNSPLTAPLRNNNMNCNQNSGGMKPSVPDNNVYIH
ncbi:RNA recognition motif [Rhizoctonia solani]|uniref:RNA recognition motif n=1 Tax=Rhizoctonia solani TaxID=456999 RepID=A0A8H7IIR9_9AGAM|nr:RNA recognition motif [Rhizoctonia solani]